MLSSLSFLEPSTTWESSTTASKLSTILLAGTSITTWKTRCEFSTHSRLKTLPSTTTMLSTATGRNISKCRSLAFATISTKNRKRLRSGIALCGTRKLSSSRLKRASMSITFSSSFSVMESFNFYGISSRSLSSTHCYQRFCRALMPSRSQQFFFCFLSGFRWFLIVIQTKLTT